MTDDSINSIDQAIEKCTKNAELHRRAASRILFMLIQISLAILLGLIFFGYILYRPFMGLSEEVATSTLFSNTIVFALLAIFTIVFGVLMSVYRFHLNEASKAEHYEIGFMRIRVAANNQGDGFKSEVRESLTENAFSYESSSQGIFKSKKVESPLPGHPTSDITALVLDKIFDKFDLAKKQSDNTKTP